MGLALDTQADPGDDLAPGLGDRGFARLAMGQAFAGGQGLDAVVICTPPAVRRQVFEQAALAFVIAPIGGSTAA